MRQLTKKQELFVGEYMVDLNATQAAIRAGYSIKSAYSIGQENLTKPELEAAIDIAMKEREKRTLVTADRVVQELAKIAFSDIREFVEFEPVEVVVGNDKDGNPIKQKVNRVTIRPDSEVDGAVLAEVKQTQHGITVKPHDKMKALELLGRHLAMFTDKLQTSDSNFEILLADINEEEIEEARREISRKKIEAWSK